MTKPKLPALTEADIEALPAGPYETGSGDRVLKLDTGMFYTVDEVRYGAAGVAEHLGGITARLIDPAPLLTLLSETRDWLYEDNCGDTELTERIEAALEGNDG